MKKLAIVTISYGTNYGNKLQNYAMQKVYYNEKYDCETIRFIPHINKKKEYLSKFRRLNLSKIVNIINKKINHKKINNIIEKRNNNFDKFNQLIVFSERKYTENNYIDIKEKYDIYSVGSDQVWNSTFSDFSDYYLLKFIDKNKKIAYAPSFGISKLPKNDILKFKKALSDFKSLSVREENGKDIIYNILKIDVPVVLDPTLLLTKDEWNMVSNIPIELKNDKYIFIYFLGGMDKKTYKSIKKYADKNECQIIDILNPFCNLYSSGPAEFIGLISNAFAIFTDSFHASVFSILYEKPFMVFNRKNQTGGKMNSRIDNLLKTFDLNDRRYIDGFFDLFKIDYKKVKKILVRERKQSLEYIKDSLK